MSENAPSFREVVDHFKEKCHLAKRCGKCKLYLPTGCCFLGLVNNSNEIRENVINTILKVFEEERGKNASCSS